MLLEASCDLLHQSLLQPSGPPAALLACSLRGGFLLPSFALPSTAGPAGPSSLWRAGSSMLFRSTRSASRSQGGAGTGTARDGIAGDSETDAGYFSGSGPEDGEVSGPESNAPAVRSPQTPAVPAIPQAVVQAIQAARQSSGALPSDTPPATPAGQDHPVSPSSKPGLLARTLLGRRQQQRRPGAEGGRGMAEIQYTVHLHIVHAQNIQLRGTKRLILASCVPL
jgi:hypothetical protein